MGLDWKNIGTTLLVVVVGTAIAMFAYDKIKNSTKATAEIEA